MQGRSDSVVRERRSEARCRPRGRVPDGAGAVGRKTPDREPEGVDVNRGPEALLPAPDRVYVVEMMGFEPTTPTLRT